MKSEDKAFIITIICFLMTVSFIFYVSNIPTEIHTITYNTTIIQPIKETITATTMEKVYYKDEYQFVMPSEQCKGKKLSQLEQMDVQGLSMEPTVFHTDTLLIMDYDKRRDIVPGDLVVIELDEETNMMHRATSVYDDEIITKGDGNGAYDEQPFAYSQIKYIVCGVLRT